MGVWDENYAQPHPIDASKMETKEDIKDWLFKQFSKKERLLSHFYSEETAGCFPGTGKEIKLKTRRTFPYFVFWTGALVATLSTSKGRDLYLKMWSTLGFASVLYMATLHETLQS